MNVSFLITRILFCMLFCTQLTFGMKRSDQLTAFPFPELKFEMQLAVMKQSDDYGIIQKTSKIWNEELSIQKRGMIVNVFSSLPKERMVDIFLNAVYEKNYKGVESILKHSTILMATSGSLYHYIKTDVDGKKVILHPYGIAEDNEDKNMLGLLCAYNVPKFAEERMCKPTKLMMTCLAGNSKNIGWHLNESTANMKNAFAIAIDCDRGKCLSIVINDLYWDSNTYDMMLHMKQISSLLKKEFLKRACDTKKIKALKELLASNNFCLNEIENGKTLLDEILELAEVDLEYHKVASLLQEYGAKTAKKLATDADDEQYMLGKITFPGCVIC